MNSIRLMLIVLLSVVMHAHAADEQKNLNNQLFNALWEENVLVVEIQDLVRRGANVKAVADLQPYGHITPCHIAAKKDRGDLIRIFAENGADVNVKDGIGFTPLHAACMDGASNAVEALLICGADTQAKFANTTPAGLAHDNGFQDIVKLLEDHENISDIKEPEGN